MHNYYIMFESYLKDNAEIFTKEIQGSNVIIRFTLRKKPHKCPTCGKKTTRVHDYRLRTIKHGVHSGFHEVLHYRRRRYLCTCCGTKFPEKQPFVNRYAHISHLNKQLVIQKAKSLVTQKYIAHELNISATTVRRYLDIHLNSSRPKLSKVIGFDEFKNVKGRDGKYAFTIVDLETSNLIDMVHSRRLNVLNRYFQKIPLKERKQVKVVVIDLWSPYKTLVKRFFPHAKLIADKFHFIRYVTKAFDQVRLRVMKQYSSQQMPYRFLKKYWKVLLKSPKRLRNTYRIEPLLSRWVNELGISDYATTLDPDLYEATDIKDDFLSKIASLSVDEIPTYIDTFINRLYHSTVPEFSDIFKTFVNWKEEIIQALSIKDAHDKSYTNGKTEGINNYLKVFKRIGFGYRNFKRFKQRFMYIKNPNYRISAT